MAGLRSIVSSKFARQVAMLSAGSVVGQLIPLLASPLVTRLYSADEFGAYVIILALSAVLLTVSSLRYDAAILQAKQPHQLKSILMLGTAASLSMCFIVAVGLALAVRFEVLPLTLQQIGYWLLGVPLLAIFNAAQNLLVALNIKEGAFRTISVSTIQKATAATTLQVLLGWFGFGLEGLLAGSVCASIAANQRLIAGQTHLLSRPFPTYRILAAVARRFADFPMFTMPGSLINSLALNSVVVILGISHTTHDIGQFGLAQRSVAGPMKTISDAVGQVFLQRASASMDNPAALRKLYVKTAAMLAAIAFMVLVPISFWLEDIFAVVFGESWRMAGQLSVYLLPLVGIRFVVSPISGITNFKGMNALSTLLQVAILLTSVVSLLLADKLQLDIMDTIKSYALTASLAYVLYAIAVFVRLSGLSKQS